MSDKEDSESPASDKGPHGGDTGMAEDVDATIEPERKRRLHASEMEKEIKEREMNLLHESNNPVVASLGVQFHNIAVGLSYTNHATGKLHNLPDWEQSIREQDDRIQEYTDNVMVAPDCEPVNVHFAPSLSKEDQRWYFDSSIPPRDAAACDLEVVFIDSVCDDGVADAEGTAVNTMDLCARRKKTWTGHMMVEPRVICDTAGGGLFKPPSTLWFESSGELFMESYWSEHNKCLCVVSEPTADADCHCPDATVLICALDDGNRVVVSAVQRKGVDILDTNNDLTRSNYGESVFLRKIFSTARNMYYAILKFNRLVSTNPGVSFSIASLPVRSVWGAECRPSGLSEEEVAVQIMMGLAYAARAYRLPTDAAVCVWFGPAVFKKIHQEQLFDVPTCNGTFNSADADNFSQVSPVHGKYRRLTNDTISAQLRETFLRFARGRPNRGGVFNYRLHEVSPSQNPDAAFDTSSPAAAVDDMVLERCTLTYKLFKKLDKGAVHSHADICSYFDVTRQCLIVASGEHASRAPACQEGTVFVLNPGQIFAVCPGRRRGHASWTPEHTKKVFLRAVFETARNVYFAVLMYNRRAYAMFQCQRLETVSMQMWCRERPEGVLESETVAATIQGLFYVFKVLRKPSDRKVLITLAGDELFAARDGGELADMYQEALDAKISLALPQIVTPFPTSGDKSSSDEEDSGEDEENSEEEDSGEEEYSGDTGPSARDTAPHNGDNDPANKQGQDTEAAAEDKALPRSNAPLASSQDKQNNVGGQQGGARGLANGIGEDKQETEQSRHGVSARLGDRTVKACFSAREGSSRMSQGVLRTMGCSSC